MQTGSMHADRPITYSDSISQQYRLVSSTANHPESVRSGGELDCRDGRRVVIEGLDEAVVLLHIKHMNQSVATGSG